MATTGTTVVPYDNTVPQNTEGDQYLSQAITPNASPNILQITAHGNFAVSANAASGFITALFQDSTASALSVVMTAPVATGIIFPTDIQYQMLANTTSSTTLKIRAGNVGAATTTFNGQGGAAEFGGALYSYIRIQEIMD